MVSRVAFYQLMADDDPPQILWAVVIIDYSVTIMQEKTSQLDKDREKETNDRWEHQMDSGILFGHG